MGDICSKLNEQLDRLMYERKVENGDYLTRNDITFIFSTLKQADIELEPLFETVEKMIGPLFDVDHYLVRNTIKELLEYYNIIDNDNGMKTRHKLYFSESKKLVKKPYFSQKALDKVKLTFKTNRIFKKL